MKLWASLLVMSIPLATEALNPPKLSFNHFEAGDGFYGKSVLVLLQDSRDFLWVGTREGLYRYNGYAFEVFQHNSVDPNCINSNVIGSIAEDMEGNIWVGTDKGINLFNRAGNNFLKEFAQNDQAGALLQTQNVSSLFVDRLNNIWAGTDRSELFVLKKKPKDRDRELQEENETGPVTSLVIDREPIRVSHADLIQNHGSLVFIDQDENGDIRVGGLHAFYIVDPENLGIKRKVLFADARGFTIQNGITKICRRSNNIFWMGSIEGGLYKFNTATHTIKPYYLKDGKKGRQTIDLITNIYEDKKGNLWVGTRDQGLFLYDQKTDRFHNYSTDPSYAKSLSNNTILAVLRDKFDLLWVGTWNGLNKGIFENRQFVNVKALPTSREKAEVKAFYIDKNGKIWMATDHGLNILNADFTLYKQFKYRPNDDTGISHFVTSDIKEGPGGKIYLATFGGIDIFDENINIVGHIRKTDDPDKSLSNNFVFDMVIDGHILWAGTNNGLNSIDLNTGKIKKYYTADYGESGEDIVSSTIIYALGRDSAGNIWAGGNKGLIVTHEESGRVLRYLHNIHDSGSISNNSIREVFIDRRGSIWVGTTNGLNRWLPEQNRFEKYFTDKQPNIEVTSISEDNEGRLWLGTKMNLMRFDPQNGEVTKYHEHDGINSCKFIQHATFIDKTGRFYFGTSDGMIAFYPEYIKKDTIRPKVYITDIKLLNKSLRNGEEIKDRIKLDESAETWETVHIYPDDYIISFEWAALYFTAPKYIQYKYRLDNFEKEWKEVDASHRYTSYSNLPGGQYTFRVIASNDDGIWSDEGTSVPLVVHPRIWETLWFKVINVLVVVLFFILYSLYRSYKNRLISKRLEEEVSKRTKLIEEQKMKMSRQYQKIEKQKDQLLNKTEKLGNVQKELKQSNARLNRLNESLENLVEERTKELKLTIERLEDTDSELNTFLYHASHDLRGPLTTLLGLSTLSENENADAGISNILSKSGIQPIS